MTMFADADFDAPCASVTRTRTVRVVSASPVLKDGFGPTASSKRPSLLKSQTNESGSSCGSVEPDASNSMLDRAGALVGARSVAVGTKRFVTAASTSGRPPMLAPAAPAVAVSISAWRTCVGDIETPCCWATLDTMAAAEATIGEADDVPPKLLV